MGDDPGEGFGTVVGRENMAPVSGFDGPSLEDDELDSVVDPEDVLEDDELADEDAVAFSVALMVALLTAVTASESPETVEFWTMA